MSPEPVLPGEVVEKVLSIGVGCYLTFLAKFHEKKSDQFIREDDRYLSCAKEGSAFSSCGL